MKMKCYNNFMNNLMVIGHKLHYQYQVEMLHNVLKDGKELILIEYY